MKKETCGNRLCKRQGIYGKWLRTVPRGLVCVPAYSIETRREGKGCCQHASKRKPNRAAEIVAGSGLSEAAANIYSVIGNGTDRSQHCQTGIECGVQLGIFCRTFCRIPVANANINRNVSETNAFGEAAKPLQILEQASCSKSNHSERLRFPNPSALFMRRGRFLFGSFLFVLGGALAVDCLRSER